LARQKEFSGQTKLNAVQHSWFPITMRKSRQINEAVAQILGIGKFTPPADLRVQ
jgi:hypothetical protein